jgi:hypothetical protein
MRADACTNRLSPTVITTCTGIRVTFSSTVFGATSFTCASNSSDLVRVLVRDQPHAHLRHRHRQQHRPSAFL